MLHLIFSFVKETLRCSCLRCLARSQLCVPTSSTNAFAGLSRWQCFMCCTGNANGVGARASFAFRLAALFPTGGGRHTHFESDGCSHLFKCLSSNRVYDCFPTWKAKRASSHLAPNLRQGTGLAHLYCSINDAHTAHGVETGQRVFLCISGTIAHRVFDTSHAQLCRLP